MTRWHIGASCWPGVSKLVEEAGEVLQICGKLMQTGGASEHWSHNDLYDAFANEVGDLLAAVDFVLLHAPEEMLQRVFARRAHKLALFETWHREQQTAVVDHG